MVKSVEKNARTDQDNTATDFSSPTSAQFHFCLILVSSLAKLPPPPSKGTKLSRCLSEVHPTSHISTNVETASRVSHHSALPPAVLSVKVSSLCSGQTPQIKITAPLCIPVQPISASLACTLNKDDDNT